MSADTLTPLIFQIFRAGDALTEAGDGLVADLSLTSARWRVMGAMAALSEPATVSQIARAMGLTRQAVQRTANDLKASGLVAFRRNPAHARAALIEFTEVGRQAYAEAIRRHTPWATRLGEGLSLEDVKTARRVLSVLAAAALPPPEQQR